jgi:zinc/manganese transport system ATP-binding protein
MAVGLGVGDQRCAVDRGLVGARMSEAVTIDHLTVAYERRPAIQDISGIFQTGTLTAIVGPNGAGKSTLLKAIAGIVRPVSGRVTFGLPRDRLAYLPQQSEIERGFPITVADAVLLGRWRRLGWHRRADGDDLCRVQAALEAVGIGTLGDRLIATLSSGQFQRMLFARLIEQDSPLILLDEPFTALDEGTTADLLAILADWHREGRTIIAVLHDIAQVRAHFPETLLLARRLIGWGPTDSVLTSQHLATARATAESWDSAAAA